MALLSAALVSGCGTTPIFGSNDPGRRSLAATSREDACRALRRGAVRLDPPRRLERLARRALESVVGDAGSGSSCITADPPAVSRTRHSNLDPDLELVVLSVLRDLGPTRKPEFRDATLDRIVDEVLSPMLSRRYVRADARGRFAITARGRARIHALERALAPLP